MTEEEVLNYLRTHILLTGDFRIEYNGKKFDTHNGKTESWTITRKLPIFKKGEEQNEKEKQERYISKI